MGGQGKFESTDKRVGWAVGNTKLAKVMSAVYASEQAALEEGDEGKLAIAKERIKKMEGLLDTHGVSAAQAIDHLGIKSMKDMGYNVDQSTIESYIDNEGISAPIGKDPVAKILNAVTKNSVRDQPDRVKAVELAKDRLEIAGVSKDQLDKEFGKYLYNMSNDLDALGKKFSSPAKNKDAILKAIERINSHNISTGGVKTRAEAEKRKATQTKLESAKLSEETGMKMDEETLAEIAAAEPSQRAGIIAKWSEKQDKIEQRKTKKANINRVDKDKLKTLFPDKPQREEVEALLTSPRPTDPDQAAAYDAVKALMLTANDVMRSDQDTSLEKDERTDLLIKSRAFEAVVGPKAWEDGKVGPFLKNRPKLAKNLKDARKDRDETVATYVKKIMHPGEWQLENDKKTRQEREATEKEHKSIAQYLKAFDEETFKKASPEEKEKIKVTRKKLQASRDIIDKQQEKEAKQQEKEAKRQPYIKKGEFIVKAFMGAQREHTHSKQIRSNYREEQTKLSWYDSIGGPGAYWNELDADEKFTSVFEKTYGKFRPAVRKKFKAKMRKRFESNNSTGIEKDFKSYSILNKIDELRLKPELSSAERSIELQEFIDNTGLKINAESFDPAFKTKMSKEDREIYAAYKKGGKQAGIAKTGLSNTIDEWQRESGVRQTAAQKKLYTIREVALREERARDSSGAGLKLIKKGLKDAEEVKETTDDIKELGRVASITADNLRKLTAAAEGKKHVKIPPKKGKQVGGTKEVPTKGTGE